MLELLRIHNLALIEDVSMEFSSGMNALTGETGAGKSFILKALNFVTGEKLGSELVRPGKEKAVVEALFVINGEEKILRRELTAETGRSRLYINDQLASQDMVKELKPALIVHTSQHGQQKLLQPSYQAKMLDDFMQRPDLLEKKDSLVKKLTLIVNKRHELDKKVAELQEKRDMLEFQQEEIQKVAPEPGEEERLEAEREAFRQQSESGEIVETAMELLRGDKDALGIIPLLASIERPLRKLVATSEAFTPFLDATLDAASHFADLERELRKISTAKLRDFNIEKLESRLYALAQLKRKLKRPLHAIIALKDEIDENLSFLDSCEMEKKQLAGDEKIVGDELLIALNELFTAREQAAQKFSNALENELKKLGFSDQVEVIFSFTAHQLHPEREDLSEMQARMLWKPNPGQPPQPLDKIASGGELSRFLLAVVSLMSQLSRETPTLIFDEVDSGVGGLTLNSVAECLNTLAGVRQMLLITHWPQLAAKAKRHFFIKKEIIHDETYTSCSLLQQDAIEGELIRMAGGGEQGAALARQLLV